MTRLADALRRADVPGAPIEPEEPEWPVVAPSVEVPSAEPASVTTRTWFPQEPHPHNDDPLAEIATPQFSEEVAQKLVTDYRSRPAAVEQYRRLAAALHHSQKQFGTKVLMVASAVNSEGKSLSIVNLALTLSHSYRRRVLLVDGDLRHPGLHEIFQLPATAGLSEALRANTERALPLFEVSRDLVVLPAGRPDADPLGGLASERMTRIINEASSEFDWVLLDTPPVGLVPDAKLLAAFADAILLVIRAGRSPCVLVKQAIESLGPEKIIGVLLNATETVSTRQRNGYYGYGYGAHYGERS